MTNNSANPIAGRISNGFCNSGVSDFPVGNSFRNILSDRITPTPARITRRYQRFGRNDPLINQISTITRRYITLLASNAACNAVLPRAGLLRAILPTESVIAVLETIPPRIPDNHSPTFAPNFFSNKYPTNPRVDTMITICHTFVGLI